MVWIFVLWPECFTTSLDVVPSSFYLQEPGIWSLVGRVGGGRLGPGMEIGAGSVGIVKIKMLSKIKGANKCKLTLLGIREGLEGTRLIHREVPAGSSWGRGPHFTSE